MLLITSHKQTQPELMFLMAVHNKWDNLPYPCSIYIQGLVWAAYQRVCSLYGIDLWIILKWKLWRYVYCIIIKGKENMFHHNSVSVWLNWGYWSVHFVTQTGKQPIVKVRDCRLVWQYLCFPDPLSTQPLCFQHINSVCACTIGPDNNYCGPINTQTPFSV